VSAPRGPGATRDGDAVGAAWLQDVLLQLRKVKALADGALAQTSDAHFFAELDGETNSIALTLKHLCGNMRSRWTDFLTTDGEKPDRQRDREFVREAGDTRAVLAARWEECWRLVLSVIGALEAADLSRTVTIRGEPHSVLQAIQRQVSHYSYHVGQIVLLARHHAGPGWRSLSIPRGESATYEVARDGSTFDPRKGSAP